MAAYYAPFGLGGSGDPGGQGCQGCPGGQGGPGGPRRPDGQVVHVVKVVKVVSLDDIHSKNIWFTWSRPSGYLEKLRCHTSVTHTPTDIGK